MTTSNAGRGIAPPAFSLTDAIGADDHGRNRQMVAQEKERMNADRQTDGLGAMRWNKNEGKGLGWRDLIAAAETMQEAKRGVSMSQNYASIDFLDAKEPLLFVPFSDWHLGSFGANYGLMVEFVELVKKHNIKVGWIGDMLQMSIKLRGVLEVMDNVLTPDLQMIALESFADEVKDNTLFSTWDNHSVMREENAVGYSRYAEIWKKRTIWFNGIGHLDITVGDSLYKLAVSHFFRGRSMMNPVHGQMRYARMEANSRDLIIAGDSHVPGMMTYKEGGEQRTAINCGSLQASGYGQRFFSLTEHFDFPCVMLRHDRKCITPFWTLKEMLQAAGRE